MKPKLLFYANQDGGKLMQAKSKLLLLTLIIAVVVPGASFAFAQSEGSDVTNEELQKIAGEVIAGTVAAGGAGGAMGALYSFLRVGGKAIRSGLEGKKMEPIIIYKVILTAVVGGILGSLLGGIGIPAAEAAAWDFVVVVFVAELIMPILSNRSWKGPAIKPS